jgi:hypothetical protein
MIEHGDARTIPKRGLAGIEMAISADESKSID